MQIDNDNYINEDAMTSPVIEQNKTKYHEDVMTDPRAEEKKNQCPSCGQDAMSIPKTDQEDSNHLNEDAMTSPIIEQNKIKYHEDVMTDPKAEEKKNQCPSCGQDAMSKPKIDNG